MADGDLELIQSGYEAFGRGDIPGVLAILSDDIEWTVTEVLPQGGHLRGKGDVAGFFERLPSIWEGLNIDVDDFCASGERVCVIGNGSGSVKGTQTGYGFVHAWTVRDGKAVRFHEYADPAPELLA
jgi:ketosteroid isomerase-like protein